MKSSALTCDIPTASALHPRVAHADFHDCHSVAVADAAPTALGLFLRVASQTPGWVNALMDLRNRIVALFGLKHLGSLRQIDAVKPEAAYKPGDRVGIFRLVQNTPDEVILEDRDKHLDVMLSILKVPPGADGVHTIAVSTVVHIHNWLGRVYMVPVGPIHKLIVPAMLSRLARDRAD